LTQLPILRLTDVDLSFGGKPLFSRVNVILARGERAALVGRNGAGKSTLMRIMTGQIEPDTGDVWRQPGVETTSIAQEPDLSGFHSVLEFCVARGAEPWRAEAELAEFGVDPAADPVTLSGGQTRRAALARAFAEDPDILLLDEPTNHLDITMIETLEQRLLQFTGAALLVSHDRCFMETVTTNTLWLRDGAVIKSAKGYADFERWAEEIEQADERQLAKMKTQLKAERHWLARGVTGRRKRNMGRLARLKDMRAEHARRQSALATAQNTADLSVQTGSSQSRKVLETVGLCKAFGTTPIVQDLDFRVLRGDRIGLVGPNGVGKTSLIRLLFGEIEADSGRVKRNTTQTVTYLDQTRARLTDTETLWEALAPNGGDSLTVQGQSRHVAAYAKDFLFMPEQLRQPVAALSGGERNRLTLAIALAQATDVLVLDEPTNDLDIQTLDLLEDMLLNFSGTLLLVSHDRAFLDATVTSCLVPLGDGKWVRTAGGWSDVRMQIQASARPSGSGAARENKPKAPKRPSRSASKLSYKDVHRLQQAEAEIPELEAKINTLQTALADATLYQRDKAAFDRLSQDLQKAREQLSQAEEDWLEIEEKRAALEA
jgi:ATP-binding cassette subfamily F protein uup